MLDQPLQVSGNLGGVHISLGVMPSCQPAVSSSRPDSATAASSSASEIRKRSPSASASSGSACRKEQRGKCRGQESLEHVLPHFTFHSSLESTEKSVTIS